MKECKAVKDRRAEEETRRGVNGNVLYMLGVLKPFTCKKKKKIFCSLSSCFNVANKVFCSLTKDKVELKLQFEKMSRRTIDVFCFTQNNETLCLLLPVTWLEKVR